MSKDFRCELEMQTSGGKSALVRTDKPQSCYLGGGDCLGYASTQYIVGMAKVGWLMGRQEDHDYEEEKWEPLKSSK